MLFVCTASWKPERDEDLWKRLAERRVPLPEEIKVKEYYYLLGQHKMVVIAEAPDEATIAKSAINWADIGEVKYIPAMTAREYLKLRKELLK